MITNPLIYKITHIATAKTKNKKTIFMYKATSFNLLNNCEYNVKIQALENFNLQLDCYYKINFNENNKYLIKEVEEVDYDFEYNQKTQNYKFRKDTDE
jgi:hypothetical protein